MNAPELIAAFRALHPLFNQYVQESIDAGWHTEPRAINFEICSNIHRSLCCDSHLFSEETFRDFGLLIEKAMIEGDEFVDTAVSTAIVESFCHFMNHNDAKVAPIVAHFGPKAFEHIEGYSRFMHGPDEQNWAWVNFLREHNIPRIKTA